MFLLLPAGAQDICLNMEMISDIAQGCRCSSGAECDKDTCIDGVYCFNCAAQGYFEAENYCVVSEGDISPWRDDLIKLLKVIGTYAFAFESIFKELYYGLKNGLDDLDERFKFPELFATVGLGLFAGITLLVDFFKRDEWFDFNFHSLNLTGVETILVFSSLLPESKYGT